MHPEPLECYEDRRCCFAAARQQSAGGNAGKTIGYVIQTTLAWMRVTRNFLCLVDMLSNKLNINLTHYTTFGFLFNIAFLFGTYLIILGSCNMYMIHWFRLHFEMQCVLCGEVRLNSWMTYRLSRSRFGQWMHIIPAVLSWWTCCAPTMNARWNPARAISFFFSTADWQSTSTFSPHRYAICTRCFSFK